MHALVQVEQSLVQPSPVLLPPHSVHARCRISLPRDVGNPQRLRRAMLQKRSELLLGIPLYTLPYPLGPL